LRSKNPWAVSPRPHQEPIRFSVSFRYDGLRQYARVDVPLGAMPADGYPVVVFLHGWVGEQAAPAMDFTFAHSLGLQAPDPGFADAASWW
jgi:hypothetical protein